MTVKERNTGIDLLRMVSMYLVVVLHLLMKALPGENGPGLFFELTWLMETAAYAAVDCYALISGFVGAGRRVSLGRAAAMWLQVEFYSLGIAAISELAAPGFAGDEARLALMPVLTGRYWYVTAYFCLMLFLPLLEAGIEWASTKRLGAVSLAILLLSFLLLSKDAAADVVGFGNGYNTVWLAALYVVGAYLGRSELLKRAKWWLLAPVYVACVLLTWIKRLRGDWTLLSYVSPTVLLSAVTLVLLFARLRLPGWAVKAVRVMSPAALGVYLIHMNPIVFKAVTSRIAPELLNQRPAVFAVLIFAAALAVYLLGTAIELARIRLFGLLKVQRHVEKNDVPAGR